LDKISRRRKEKRIKKEEGARGLWGGGWGGFDYSCMGYRKKVYRPGVWLRLEGKKTIRNQSGGVCRVKRVKM